MMLNATGMKRHIPYIPKKPMMVAATACGLLGCFGRANGSTAPRACLNHALRSMPPKKRILDRKATLSAPAPLQYIYKYLNLFQ
jgi:hypothetical protein